MKIVRTRDEVRSAVASLRGGPREREHAVALVPTMGALHEGHLSLVDRAGERADHVVVSIFVNPLQFAPDEDFERYPRDLQADARLVAQRGAELVFAPSRDEMYGSGVPAVQVVPVRMADRLCGAYRPGHFQGVLTVVAKLFNIVEPDVAIFGRKDFQQSVLIRAMVRDLDMDVAIDVAPIVREGDGLAMSSRNAYLDLASRERATRLYKGLRAAAAAFAEGERDAATLRDLAASPLRDQEGIRPQYVELVEADTLEPLEQARPGSVLAVAAHVGGTRLIDNIVLE